ncbi:putative membrane protein [Veillonella atypica ACS-049-V-Sch6]|uniref:Putative membrane protein n=1 Tax=Veillonella atypica ACS-049-V-Sch6 TaxID=866776 RepID=E1L420_9FIRM|nr:DMT family transporter [Veillonella atypica]EFL56968.1 putative membrane protein [Veillonella atypica ACS-049-V-Sch6]
MEEKQWIGMGLAIMGALFWGLSGTSVQFLENAKHLNVEWLLEVRLLLAGLLTILLSYIQDGIRIFDIFKNPKDFGKLLIFGLFGIALAQYSYFKAIVISGVGVATVLQYVAPTLLIIYLFLRYFKKPTPAEFCCVLLALTGTICIVSQGGLDISTINGDALFWGLISAASICVYTLQPIELLKKYSTTSIVGVAMFICGILSLAMFQQIDSEAIWDGMTWVGLFTIIILGTVVSFNAYIEGVRRIGAVQGSILSSLEPISAALFGWALLGNEFTLVGIFGMICIIATVFIIAWDRQRQIKRDVLEKLNKKEII